MGALDVWDEPTPSVPYRVAVTLRARIKKRNLARCLEAMADLARRGALLAPRIEPVSDDEAEITLWVPAEEIEWLREVWPVPFSCPELDDDDEDQEDTGVHSLPEELP